MYRIAVCDANVADGQELVNKVHQLAAEMKLEVQVESFRSARSLLEAFKEKRYKVVLLETEIGGSSGIELAKRLRFKDSETELIFVTDKDEYALAAYAVFPVGYILKRVTRAKLYDPFARIFRKGKPSRALSVKTATGGELILPVEDILYIEVYGNELDFHCKGGTYRGIGTLGATAALLPEAEFYRSHRNFIVNMQYVQRVDRYDFGMQNGDTVPIAKNRFTVVKEAFEQYLRS
jgi:DNA-binding LytR/AlgR family response regulator